MGRTIASFGITHAMEEKKSNSSISEMNKECHFWTARNSINQIVLIVMAIRLLVGLHLLLCLPDSIPFSLLWCLYYTGHTHYLTVISKNTDDG